MPYSVQICGPQCILLLLLLLYLCFFFFSYRQRETYGFHILAHRKIGEGEGRDAWVCFENYFTSVKAKSRTYTVCLFIFLHFLFLLIFLSTFFSLSTCVIACRSRSSSYSLDQLSFSTEAGQKRKALLPKLRALSICQNWTAGPLPDQSF